MPIVRGRNIEVLFSAETIARRNLELAKEIAAREFHDLLIIAILKGSFIFAADLIRCMHGAGLAPLLAGPRGSRPFTSSSGGAVSRSAE